MKKNLRVCFVGDSFVNGTGDPQCLGWSGRVCAAACAQGHDVTFYNLGIRRQTSADIRARWQAEVKPRLPGEVNGAIVFSFGVNDATLENGRPRCAPEQTAENAAQILATAASAWPALMVGPPPVAEDDMNRRIAALCNRLQQVAGAAGVDYLPVFEPLRQSPRWVREAQDNDGAHPRSGGYQELAGLVQAWPAWQAWFR